MHEQPSATSSQPTFTVRRAKDRGHADHGWLDSWHTFSFADYYDPAHMSFRSLRVINDDRIAPGAGFPSHPHHDMEIITYVLDGAVAHKDSMGNGSVIRPGEVQRMSAGTGVVHSEFNHSQTEPLRLLQIWIKPSQLGLAPGYEQKAFSTEERLGRLRLVASPDGADGSVTLQQNARIYAGLLDMGEKTNHAFASSRHAWLQVARGQVRVNNSIELMEGDGLAVQDAPSLEIEGIDSAEVLLFDLS